MASITVDVLQKHIDEGVRGRCHLCPISQAVLDMPGVTWAYTRYDGCYYKRDGDFLRVGLPLEAMRFIQDFDGDDHDPDDGGPMAVVPFSFTAQEHQADREWCLKRGAPQ